MQKLWCFRVSLVVMFTQLLVFYVVTVSVFCYFGMEAFLFFLFMACTHCPKCAEQHFLKLVEKKDPTRHILIVQNVQFSTTFNGWLLCKIAQKIRCFSSSLAVECNQLLVFLVVTLSVFYYFCIKAFFPFLTCSIVQNVQNSITC